MTFCETPVGIVAIFRMDRRRRRKDRQTVVDFEIDIYVPVAPPNLAEKGTALTCSICFVKRSTKT